MWRAVATGADGTGRDSICCIHALSGDDEDCGCCTLTGEVGVEAVQR